MKNDDLKITIEEFNVDWLAIKNRARGTVGMQDSSKIPTDDWIRKILVAEHSVLRHSLISIKIENIKFYSMGHFVRHNVGVTPFVQTSREDRTNTPRNERKQTDLVNMRLDLNIQSLINISRKRLCFCADNYTRLVWLKIIREVAKFDKNIAWACVNEGIYKGGCPESFNNNCRYCVNFLNNLDNDTLTNIFARYDAFNDFRQNSLDNGGMSL